MAATADPNDHPFHSADGTICVICAGPLSASAHAAPDAVGLAEPAEAQAEDDAEQSTAAASDITPDAPLEAAAGDLSAADRTIEVTPTLSVTLLEASKINSIKLILISRQIGRGEFAKVFSVLDVMFSPEDVIKIETAIEADELDMDGLLALANKATELLSARPT